MQNKALATRRVVGPMGLTISLLVVVMVVCAAQARAETKVAEVFGSHMVLQRDRPVVLWGWDEPGTRVSVRIGEHETTALTNANEQWRAELPAMQAGGPHTVSINGTSDLELTDVLVGEVWLCSGQSNMRFGLAASANGKHAIARAENPNLRLFQVPMQCAKAPRQRFVQAATGWQASHPQSARSFSAVAFHFGQKLQRELGVPVGLINSSFGGTPAEAWIPKDVMRSNEAVKATMARRNEAAKKNNKIVTWKQQQRQLRQWRGAVKKARQEKRKPPRRPGWPLDQKEQSQPGATYNAMIHPIVPLSIRGVLWYQGESSAGHGEEYEVLLQTLITTWRQRWNQDLPFGIIQLPNFRAPQTKPFMDSGWCQVREAQRRVAHTDPNAGLIITLGLGHARDIHPKRKQPVGSRAARWALVDIYQKGEVATGPVFASAKRSGSEIHVEFSSVGKGLKSRNKQPPMGFAGKVGEDQWVSLRAKIINPNTVALQVDSKLKPSELVYAWAANPRTNLVNSAGIPASPFRVSLPE